MKIFYGIDGTGNYDDSAKPIACRIPDKISDLQQSHVKRVEHYGFGKSQYVAGTMDLMTGASSAGKVTDGVQWLERAYNQSLAPKDKTKIYLSGFSRGGAAIICIAHELNKLKIPIECMYIFDAVDRSGSMSNSQTAKIPANVQQAFHALRNPAAGSRKTFGNCGTEGTNGNLKKDYFMTTHGGVGGWPNGQSRVQPGVGPEDYFYATTLGAGRAAARGYHVGNDPRQFNIHEDYEPEPSNIKPPQETAGMKRAWNWMNSNILKTLYA